MPIRQIKYHETPGPDWAARAFALPEAVYKAQVMESAWGHLSPIQGTKYYGHVLFTISCTGDLIGIDWEFKTITGELLDGGPWLYDDIHNTLIDDYSNKLSRKGVEKRGKIYRFVGSYMQFKTTGGCRFSGKTEEIVIPKVPTGASP